MEISGVEALAGRIVDTMLERASVVFVHLPRISTSAQWQAALAGSVYNRYRAGAKLQDPVAAPTDCDDAERWLLECFDAGAAHWSVAVQALGPSEPPLVIRISGDQLSQSRWQVALFGVAGYYKNLAATHHCRSLLVFVSDSPLQFEGLRDVCIAQFDLWNVMRWEDMRSMGGRLLARVEGTDPPARAWRLATYVGVANGDPFLLEGLCRDLPRSLDDLGDWLDSIAPVGDCPVVEPAVPLDALDQDYAVPAVLRSAWRLGGLFGCSSERGPQMDWACIPLAERRRRLRSLVWREQVATLLPIIIEMSADASDWVNRQLGSPRWRSEASDDGEPDRRDFEPGVVLQVLGRGGFGRVGDRLWGFLQTLRSARNKLAHLEPLELADVQQIWREYRAAEGETRSWRRARGAA